MCSIYASAARRMLPRAQIVVDLFHVVQLAVKMTGDVRRRAVRGGGSGSKCRWSGSSRTSGTSTQRLTRGAVARSRGRSDDAEYRVKGLPVRNLEHLRPEQFAKVMNILGADRHGQQILAAWIGKEKLRDALNLRAAITRSTPCERAVRGRLASFRNPANQRRRVRTACTRGNRSAQDAALRRSRLVTGWKHDPG